MQQALAGEVLDWLAEPSGECETAKLFEVLNACRARFYALYPEIPLFSISERIDIQTFCEAGEHGPYAGITLPREFQTVEAMWYGGCAVDLQSSWREWQRGYPSTCECSLATRQMSELYAVERDLRMGMPSPLRIHCEREEDEGKLASVRLEDFAGVKREWKVKLTVEPQFTDWPVRMVLKNGGVSKPRTAGHVVLAEVCGRVLSRYAPDETVPGYRRQSIVGLCQQGSVYVRGSRQMFKVYDENDVVEHALQPAWEEMALFLKLNKERGSDKQEAVYHLAQAKGLLLADHARSLGKNTRQQVRTPMASPCRLGSPYGVWN